MRANKKQYYYMIEDENEFKYLADN
jgi:hypothetical protein